MIRRLLSNTCRQWSPAHSLRQRLSVSAMALRSLDGAEAALGQAGILRQEPEEELFERNVKKRVLYIEKSLEMPKPQEPSSKDVAAWRHILALPSVEAMSTDSNDEVPSSPLQTWVLMYLLVTKTHSPSDLTFALDLVYKNLQHAPERVQPYILILATRRLAKFQTLPPMHRVVHTFLELPVRTHHLHFNLLLRAMSRFRPSVHLSKLTATILDIMQARQMRLNHATYTSLLNNRFVTLELTKRLQERMAYEGLKPNVKELESFLRNFGKHGALNSSLKYANLVRRVKLEPSSYGGVVSSAGVQVFSNSTTTHHNTHFSRSERFPSSAFQYLQSLVDDETMHASTLQEEQNLIVPSVRARTQLYAKHNGDWTPVLHAAARDKRVSSDALLILFERSKQAGLAPTLATYTVVMRGLIKKNGDYIGSLKLWRELRRGVTRPMDAMAMTVGLDALIGCGRALEAVETLLADSSKLKSVSRWTRKAERDTALLNSFMSSLQEHGWSTAVFHCWDAFQPLFHVRPDAITLTILLRAARVAERMDGSIRGLLGHINMYNPFRSVDELAVTETSSKAALKAHICSCLCNEDDERDTKANTANALRTSSLWSGTPAGPKALEVFRSVLLGNFPHLSEVNAPAKAVWSDNANDASPLRDVARGLGLVSRGAGTSFAYSENEKSAVSSGGLSSRPHPQISPDERTFHAYIELLGSQRRSSEIPLALAWMKELELVPRKETLCFALVLFAEVSLRGPLLETYGDISEYKKLVAWLSNWLGSDKLPEDSHLRWAFRRLQADRGGMINEEEESV